MFLYIKRELSLLVVVVVVVVVGKRIKPLKMPPKYSRPIKLDGIEDPNVPRQIAEELAKRNDVLEVVYFPPAQTKVKSEYRIKLKSSDEFNIFMFYTAT